jgi:hypothetical protein
LPSASHSFSPSSSLSSTNANHPRTLIDEEWKFVLTIFIYL